MVTGKKIKKVLKTKKKKLQPTDGLGPKEIEQIRKAVRQVWHWSYAKKLVIKRCTGADGFPFCENCFERVPKTYVDHIVKVGGVDEGFLKRMFTPSKNLQGLCKRCHNLKTNKERGFTK